jgi:nucleoside-diphosphate-sugar epimerase
MGNGDQAAEAGDTRRAPDRHHVTGGNVRVLVTGIDGYIGSVLGPVLSRAGHHVVGLDTGYYRAGLLYESGGDRPQTLTRDTRTVTADDLIGFDAVVHLAELSNDPLGAHRPEVTYAINHEGSMSLARAARTAGVGRFVYASSCSVYGIGGGEIKTEASPPAPQTAYAECKVLCERGLANLSDDRFVTTCLRNATAFGASPRMRFDIVLNNLAGLAWTRREIAMTSDGTPWRPLVHVRDICRAVELTLAAPASVVGGQVFNVGDESQNYRIAEIASIVAAAFPGCVTTFGPPDSDNRSYRVSFAKIREHLPDYRCEWPAERGADELARLFAWLGMSSETFAAAPFTRLTQLKRLVAAGQIDDDFFWTDAFANAPRPAAREVA